MIIKFDNREGKSVEVMMKLVDEKVTMLRTRLNEGDYCWDDVCVERKAIDDFCSSIMDGRIKSQIEKMENKYKHVYVIIVGAIKDRTTEIHENCILGKIGSLMVKYGVNVGMVDDEFQFLYLMKNIFEKHKEIRDMKFVNEETEELSKELKFIERSYGIE